MPEEGFLEVGRHLDPHVADGRHGHDPEDADQEDPAAAGVRADRVGVEQEEHVLTGDLGQAGHDQDVGGDDGPTAPPTGLGSEGPDPPGEGGPAVRVGVVHLLVAVGDEEHGDEGEDGDDRRLETDGGDHEAKGGGQAVGRCRGGDADHRARDQSERSRFETLLRTTRSGQTWRIDGHDRLLTLSATGVACSNECCFPLDDRPVTRKYCRCALDFSMVTSQSESPDALQPLPRGARGVEGNGRDGRRPILIAGAQIPALGVAWASGIRRTRWCVPVEDTRDSTLAVQSLGEERPLPVRPFVADDRSHPRPEASPVFSAVSSGERCN